MRRLASVRSRVRWARCAKIFGGRPSGGSARWHRCGRTVRRQLRFGLPARQRAEAQRNALYALRALHKLCPLRQFCEVHASELHESDRSVVYMSDSAVQERICTRGGVHAGRLRTGAPAQRWHASNSACMRSCCLVHAVGVAVGGPSESVGDVPNFALTRNFATVWGGLPLCLNDR
eukprot:66262-Chlamydomonas_euryale.AAC.4